MDALSLVNYLKDDEFCENRRTLSKWGFMIGYLANGCVHDNMIE